VLDPTRKHWPTLLTNAGFERRQDFYRRLVDLAVELGSPLVSIWSGAAEKDTPSGDAALRLLAERLAPVLDHAAARRVRICFEPEPGMRVERLEDFARLKAFAAHDALGLTIDTGHLAASETVPYAAHIGPWARDLAYVQADDAPAGRHEHRFFGEGVLDFAAIARALRESGYAGVVAVELSRHGHDAPAVARRALEFLTAHGFGRARG
jgi:sugar phosphate isomerase/epimerase